MKIERASLLIRCGCGRALEIEMSSETDMAVQCPKPIPCTCGNRIMIHLQETRKPIDTRLVEILKGNIRMHQRRATDFHYGTAEDRKKEKEAMEQCQKQLTDVLK